MVPEIMYHFTMFIHDYNKLTYCGMIMISKLLRHNYCKPTTVVRLW